MKINFRYALVILLAIFYTKLEAQSEYIVRYKGESSALSDVLHYLGDFEIKDHIALTDIYLILDKKRRSTDQSRVLSSISKNIEVICKNKPVELRSKEPNDPFYKEQWQYNVLHAPEAWEYGTGGLTCQGDTIVVAVFDSGFDPKHEDLAPNVWVNHAEIPGDGIDNDGNGYTDDVLGLNTVTDNDKHYLDSHGLKVSGVMAARGNNSKGVCGVNWNSKIMLVSYIADDFYVIKGLHYILTQRRLYNQTQGKKGAFVVSVNCSFGISNEFPEDGHEMWCSMYDSLGHEGVLSAGATTNSNKNVDVVGDIPSTCKSEYLIVVTNTDKNDKKVTNAGFGISSVDLGSPGEGIYNVALNNGYSTFTGTSAATPHVAGAVGLLYSTACCKLIEDVKLNPGKACLKVRDYILDGASTNLTLKNITKTGARLDLLGAAQQLIADCGNPTGPNKINNLTLKNLGEQIIIEFTGIGYKSFNVMVYNLLGIALQMTTIDFKPYDSNKYLLDIQDLPPSVYVVTVWDENEPVSMKFLKLK